MCPPSQATFCGNEIGTVRTSSKNPAVISTLVTSTLYKFPDLIHVVTSWVVVWQIGKCVTVVKSDSRKGSPEPGRQNVTKLHSVVMESTL
jgi:hypothetical protein